MDIFLFSNSLSPQDHICLTFLFYNIHNTVYIIYILTIVDYLQKANPSQSCIINIQTSVADPERFDADPDSTFRADADPDSNIF